MFVALIFAIEAASMACKCWGPYADTHEPTGFESIDAVRDYPLPEVVKKGLNAFALIPVIMMATHPRCSFLLVFVQFPVLLALSYIPCLTDYARYHTIKGGLVFASSLTGVCTLLYTRRELALARVHVLHAKDIERYEHEWKKLLKIYGFRDELDKLLETWREAQQEAEEGAHSTARRSADGKLESVRRQPAKFVGALFHEADLLNDILQEKMYNICLQHGGKFCGADVKSESRAMQKVFRTYGGDWHKLNDLCRVSLVFDSVVDLTACLRAISDDPEVLIVPSGDEKMRLREDFKAEEKTGGYRDVQLTVMINNSAAKERKVRKHQAEVQLHLAPIATLASKGDGHKNYKLYRNISGC